jgi:hypothetical protein
VARLIGSNGAKAISENEPNYEPECDTDCGDRDQVKSDGEGWFLDLGTLPGGPKRVRASRIIYQTFKELAQTLLRAPRQTRGTRDRDRDLYFRTEMRITWQPVQYIRLYTRIPKLVGPFNIALVRTASV